MLGGTAASAGQLLTPVLYPFDTMYEGEVREMAVGSEGQIWITQQSEFPWLNGTIEVFAPNGEPVALFRLAEAPSEEPESLPADLAAGYNGEMWFTDEQPNENDENYIGRVDGPNVERISITVQAPGPGVHSRSGPNAITRGPRGEMWFTDEHPDDSGHAFIGSVSVMGHFHAYPIPTGNEADMPIESVPMGIATDASGELWFTDHGSNSRGINFVGRIDATGKITEYPLKKVHALPTAIALGADGNMWFVETGLNRIGRITPTGDIAEFGVPFVSTAIHGITQGPDGMMWFSGGDGELGWIAPSGVTGTLVTNPSQEDSDFTGSMALGAEGFVWFTEPTPSEPQVVTTSKVGKLVRIVSPVALAPPIISGDTVDGAILRASPGTWQPKPVAVEYQWEACDAAGENCLPLEGATEASLIIGGDAIGGRLRVALTASNAAGATVARSAVSGVVQAHEVQPPPPLTVAEVPQLIVTPRSIPLPNTLGTTLTFSFSPSKGRFKRVRALTLHDLVSGSRVEVRCTGHGCALSRRVLNVAPSGCRARCPVNVRTIAPGDDNIASLFKSRRLRPGARVSVSVLMPGLVGRLFLFSVKAGRPVVFEDRCLAAGSSAVMVTCGS